MVSSTSVTFICFISSLTFSSASHLISDIIGNYKRLLGNGLKLTGVERESGTFDSETWTWQQLLQLHDEDSICSEACIRYMQHRWFQHERADDSPLPGKAMTWDRLENLVDTLYGGIISDGTVSPVHSPDSRTCFLYMCSYSHPPVLPLSSLLSPLSTLRPM